MTPCERLTPSLPGTLSSWWLLCPVLASLRTDPCNSSIFKVCVCWMGPIKVLERRINGILPVWEYSTSQKCSWQTVHGVCRSTTQTIFPRTDELHGSVDPSFQFLRWALSTDTFIKREILRASSQRREADCNHVTKVWCWGGQRWRALRLSE